LWDENRILKVTLLQIEKELQTANNEILNLKEKLKSAKAKEKNLELENKNLYEKQNRVKTTSQTAHKLIEQSKEKKKIIVVLPPDEKEYSKVIPTIDYKDISLEKNNETKTTNNIKVNPQVFIDKENNKIEGGALTIEKKF
jgi:hypothetical protein